jgi:hypothetical protein
MEARPIRFGATVAMVENVSHGDEAATSTPTPRPRPNRRGRGSGQARAQGRAADRTTTSSTAATGTAAAGTQEVMEARKRQSQEEVWKKLGKRNGHKEEVSKKVGEKALSEEEWWIGAICCTDAASPAGTDQAAEEG